jgi:predicted component of type VI protein secretion system
MKAELVPENGDPPIRIVRDLTLLGRHEDCDIVIGHPSLSKRHCLLVKTDGLLVIRDLATTNGTKVKGQRVRWAALLPEDRVSFGAYKMRIYLGSDEMPSPSEVRNARPQGNGDSRKFSAPKASVAPPSRGPYVVPPSFPEPSNHGSAPDWDTAYAESLGAAPAPAEPRALQNGFEIIDEVSEPGDGIAFEGGFELIDDDDDDDEIIELD